MSTNAHETKRKDEISIFYNSYGDNNLYEMMRRALKPGMRLITLDADDDHERATKIAGADVAIVAATPLTRSLLDAAPELKLVHHQGVGYQDTVDCEALSERGIPLALTPQGTTEAVAEMTILLMLALLRHLTFANSELRQGRWHINSLRPTSRNLRGRLVGYIGMGRVGRAAAALSKAFGARALYTDPSVSLEPREERELGLRKASLTEILQASDILSLHVPATQDTRHLINARTIDQIKQGALIVNTARGALIEENALFDGLSNGHLGGAALDVFDPEPPYHSPLLSLPNVITTPHIAGGTRDAFEAKMGAIFANVERFFATADLGQRVEWPNPKAIKP